MDADGSHQPEQLPRLLTALERAPTWCSARAGCPAAGCVNWPRSPRVALPRRQHLLPARCSASRMRRHRRLPGLPPRDPRGLGLDEVASQGYCFQVDLACRAVEAGFHVVEVPITFVERELGDSKMSRDIVVEALWRVTAWGVRDRVGKITGRARRV